MLNASIELNRSLEDLAVLFKSLGDSGGHEQCEIPDDEKTRTTIRFLKSYELCTRVDEALSDILRHQGGKELDESLFRAEEMLQELALVVRSFKDLEKGIFLDCMRPEFLKYQGRLAELLKKRPAGRIWGIDEIIRITTDLSLAVEAFRKTTAYAIIMSCAPRDKTGKCGV